MASELYEIQRNKKEAVTVWLVHIHFDDFFEIEGADFYFATTKGIEFPIGNDLIKFNDKLASFPKGRHQRERGNDYAEFSLLNQQSATYQDFLRLEEIIEKGEVAIYQCLEIEKDYYEGEIKFIGYLKDFTLSESDKSLKFTAIADTSRTGFPVAARILTRERCGTIFNFNGLNPPEYHACGWQVAQGGNPERCTYLLEGEDGCIAHGNAHRFFAVPALATAEITFVPPDEVDFPYFPSDPCFTENVFVVMPDWSIKSIKDVTVYDKIKGFNLFGHQDVIDTQVNHTFLHPNEEYVIAKFNGFAIEATKGHLFNTYRNTFAPIGSLEGKAVSGLGKDRKRAQIALNALETASDKRCVYNLHTDCSTYIITNAARDFYWFVHNRKDIGSLQV